MPYERLTPSPSKDALYFQRRATEVYFRLPHKELTGLEIFIRNLFHEPRSLQTRARYQELIQPKRMFIYFAVLYLKLPSRRIAEYLNLERSTLSHHLHRFQDEIQIYEDLFNMAKQVNNYLMKRMQEANEEIMV